MTRFRWHSYIGSLLVILTLAACAGHGHRATDPASTGLTGSGSQHSSGVEGRRFLFGLWDVSLNRETGQFEAIPMRSVAFHANVVDFMQNAANLVVIIGTEDYVTGRFDLNVTLTHPFPNSNLRGFDVRGIVFGNMSSKDDPDILSSKDDPDLLWMGPNGLHLLNPDGWTRWWNPLEFTTPGLFGYTEGIFGTKDFVCPATLNPYRYFASCLMATTPVVPAVNLTNRGTFATDEGPVTRRYELVFPILDNGFPDARFQYAIDASWAEPTGGGSAPGIEYYPPEANGAEPFYVKVDTTDSTAFYIDNANRGGELVLSISVFDWGAAGNPNGIDGEIEAIKIESPTLFGGVVLVPVFSQPGSSELNGIFTLNLPVMPPSQVDQQLLVTVVSAGDTYEPPGPGWAYPAGEKLASYIVASVPIKKLAPAVIGGIITEGQVFDLETRGNVNYLLDSLDGLQLYNVQNPESPFELNSVALPNEPIALDVENGYAFVIDSGNNLQIIDIEPVPGASIINTVALAGTPVCIDVDNGYACIGYTADAVFIYDVDPPETAFPAGSVLLNGPGPIEDVSVRDGYACVAADDLEIFDVDPPGSAGFLISVPTVSPVVTVDMSDAGYAYMGDSTNQFMVVDIEPIGSASIVETIMLGGQINDLVGKGTLSYVTINGIGMGVVAFDPSTGQAVEVADVGMPKSAEALAVEGNMAYVDGDVVIVELWEGAPPEDQQGWARNWGGEHLDEGYGICSDSDGNVYVSGSFEGLTADFDPGPGVDEHIPSGLADAFVSKFDKDGNFQWARTWGGDSYTFRDAGKAVAVNNFGQVYVTGVFRGTGDFDPGPGVDTHSAVAWDDSFLVSFDSGGNYLWGFSCGGLGLDWGSSVGTDSSSDAYVTGVFNDTVDFDPGLGIVERTAMGGANATFVAKYNTSGIFQWVGAWGGAYGDEPTDLAIDIADNILISGFFNSAGCDFDPGPGVYTRDPVGGSDAYLVKLDSSGNFVWAGTWGGPTGDIAHGVAAYGAGDFFVTGVYTWDVDFDPGPGVNTPGFFYGFDEFLSMFDSAGNLQWVKVWGSNQDDGGSYEVACDTWGSLTIHFEIADICDVDPGPGVDNRGPGPHCSRFNVNGDFQWAQPSGLHFFDLAVDPIGNLLSTGPFTGPFDFDPGPFEDSQTGAGHHDPFLWKLESDWSY